MIRVRQALNQTGTDQNGKVPSSKKLDGTMYIVFNYIVFNCYDWNDGEIDQRLEVSLATKA